MAAVLEIFDGAARCSNHDPELVAVADPGYSSMTEEATFPLPLGRWNDGMRATEGSN